MRLAALGFGLALGACVVHDPAPVNPGYGYPYGYGLGAGPDYQGFATPGTPTPYEVTSQAPEPLDEQMTPSPGDGFAWIDGYWHWDGYDWVWVSGRWEHEQDGYVYVPPYYDYSGSTFVYTPGYWAERGHTPPGWIVRGPTRGHPATIVPPPTWHNPTHPLRPGGGFGNGGVTPAHITGTPAQPPATSVGGYQQLPPARPATRPIGEPPEHNAPGPIEGGRTEPSEPPPILYDRPQRPVAPPVYRPAPPPPPPRPVMEGPRPVEGPRPIEGPSARPSGPPPAAPPHVAPPVVEHPAGAARHR
jgi:hypothetical protein